MELHWIDTAMRQGKIETMTASESTGERTKFTVFVIDGDPLAGATINAVCRARDFAFRHCLTGGDFLDSLDPEMPGCVVLEVQIPDASGLDIQQELARRVAVQSVIFLAARASVSIAVRAMRSGAIHFFQKPLGEQEFWTALDEAVELDQRRREKREFERRLSVYVDRLTPRDWHLLEGLLQGLTSRQLAVQQGVSERTVEDRRSNLLKKFEVRSSAELIRLVIKWNGAATPILSGRSLRP